MKRKEVKVRLSPNEEAKLIREERERRRILRIQQVREQQRNIAQHVRQRVEQRRLQELELLGEELRAQWEQKQKERVDHLQKLYQENLSLLGQGHRNAKENKNSDQDAADQKAESEIKAEERYRKALKELKLQRVKNQENQSRHIDARRKALEVEKIRSTKVASLPLPPAQPLQNAVSKSPHLVKKCNASSFAASHYHMPEMFVDRETSTSQPSACVEAEQEEQWMLMQRQEAQRRGEQQEKARLRGREALRREQLLQDRGRFLVELEHMQQTDLLRRRRQVGDMPPQIFEPLYRRQETQLDHQRNMEFAFEDMYSGERRVKGDMLCHLVPEPLPPPSTDSLCQDLDVSQDDLTTTDQYPVEQDQKPPSEECQAQHEGITPDSVKDPFHSEAKDEGKAVPPKRGLKRLLTRIQTQRRRWSNSEVVSVDSPCGQDSSIDTGSMTTPDKLSKADVEHLEPVADETQESEEQKQKEEKLEQERQEQIELLKQLEEQRLELEERLSEAHRERARLKTSMLPTLLTDTTSEPVATNHASMMEEHRKRLLQQKEIHQRSVEVARQRLEEYQRALRIRYNMRTVPCLVVPPSASQSSAVPASITPVTVPPALVPTPVSPASFLHGVVTPLPVPQNSVPPTAVLHPMDVTPTAVAPVVASSLSVAPPAFLHSAVTPSSVPSTFLTTSVPLPVATHITGRHLHPGCPTAEVQTHSPHDTVSREMGPQHAPRSDFDSGSKEELTTLKHKVFLKFLQERLGVIQTDVGNTSQPSPAVCAAPGPSVPISINLSSSSFIPATSATNLVISSRSGANASVCTVVSSAPTFTMATGSDTVIPTSNPSDSTFTHPGLSVARGVERARVGPDLIGVTRERLESRLNEYALSQSKHEVDKQEPRPKTQDQAHGNMLQALLRALERSSIGTLQHEDSDPPSSSGSRSASSGCFSVESGPPPAASKPPVSRARQGCADAVLHQLSVIEEVNTPASVSLLTGEDAVNADDFQCSKQVDSLPSPSCTLLDFAKCTDSPQSHSFTTEANNSGSSVVSSFKISIEPSSSSHPSFSSTISTGSYISTDPDLQSQPDIDCIPVESPSSSSAQRVDQNQERILDQGNTPQILQFAPLENAEVLPADEPSGLRIEESFRPLEAQMSDLSMCSATEEVTMGTQETPAVEDGAPSLELLVGHPSAHSSMIGQTLGSSPLMTWNSAESHWREGLSNAPSQTWQSTGQVFVPTELPLMHPENDSMVDPSTSSEFHHLHAEVTHNQTETTELPDQPGQEPWSLKQMRAEDCSHLGLSQCSPPEVLFFPSLKNTVEGMGILEQSQITLVSLTDSSSDEQEPVAKEEETGAWGP